MSPKHCIYLLFLTGLLIGGIGCKNSPPGVSFQPVSRSVPEVSPVPPTGFKDFQTAFTALDLSAAESLAQQSEEREVSTLASAVLYRSAPISPTRALITSDSVLAQQWHTLQEAGAWLNNDYQGLANLSQMPLAGESDPGMIQMAEGLARSPNPEKYSYGSPEFTVPLLKSGTDAPMVEVEINGEKVVFWLDTGAGVTVVSSKVAKELGIGPMGVEAVGIQSATHKTITSKPAIIDSISLGQLTVRNHPCMIMDKKALTLRLLGIPLVRIEGILGWPMIKKLDLEMDMPEEKLILRMPEELAIDQGAGGADRGLEAGMGWFWQPFLRLRTREGKVLNLKLDTGSSTTFFHPGAYEKLGVNPTDSYKVLTASAGGNEFKQMDAIDSCRFEIGEEEVTLRNVEGTNEMRAPEDLFKFDGVIGQDILSKGRFRIDFQNRRYSFVRESQ